MSKFCSKENIFLCPDGAEKNGILGVGDNPALFKSIFILIYSLERLREVLSYCSHAGCYSKFNVYILAFCRRH